MDRKLVGIDIAGTPMTDEGALNDFWPVHEPGGGAIGKVTAGAWSPRLERNIGYAWVPIEQASVGTALEIDGGSIRRDATVAPLPFWDPTKKVPLG